MKSYYLLGRKYGVLFGIIYTFSAVNNGSETKKIDALEFAFTLFINCSVIRWFGGIIGSLIDDD